MLIIIRSLRSKNEEAQEDNFIIVIALANCLLGYDRFINIHFIQSSVCAVVSLTTSRQLFLRMPTSDFSCVCHNTLLKVFLRVGYSLFYYLLMAIFLDKQFNAIYMYIALDAE